MFEHIIPIIAGVLVLLGAAFSLIAAIGINRLPDFLTRTHAASKAGTMGSGLMLLAVAMISLEGPVILRAIVGFVFLLLTAPIASHLLAKAAYLKCTPASTNLVADEYKEYCEKS